LIAPAAVGACSWERTHSTQLTFWVCSDPRVRRPRRSRNGLEYAAAAAANLVPDCHCHYLRYHYHHWLGHADMCVGIPTDRYQGTHSAGVEVLQSDRHYEVAAARTAQGGCGLLGIRRTRRWGNTTLAVAQNSGDAVHGCMADTDTISAVAAVVGKRKTCRPPFRSRPGRCTHQCDRHYPARRTLVQAATLSVPHPPSQAAAGRWRVAQSRLRCAGAAGSDAQAPGTCAATCTGRRRKH
jgi:hypothetical protein